MEAKDIILPAAALTVAATTMVAPGASAYDSKLNQTSFWGANCRKVEMPSNVTEYTPAGENISKVIVKGGTTNKVYDKAPFTGLTAVVNPKSGKVYAISHVIVCGDDAAAMPSQPIKHDDKKSDKPEVKTASTSTSDAKSTKTKSDTKQKSKVKSDKKGAAKDEVESESKVAKVSKKADKKTEQPTVIKTSSASTTGVGGVEAVMGASTDESVQATELPKTGAGTATAAIATAGAAAYAATRKLRRN